MEPKGKKMRFSDSEMATIKGAFAENDFLLKAVRKVFLQLPLSSDEEKALTTAFGKAEVCAVVSKAFLPQIDGDAPMYQVIDLWMTVDLKDKHPNDAYIILSARKLVIEYIHQQLHALALFGTGMGVSSEYKFEDLIATDLTPEQWLTNITARNTIVSHVEQQLHQLSVLAGFEKETVEETQARLAKDSMK